jgi:hypothetical protein
MSKTTKEQLIKSLKDGFLRFEGSEGVKNLARLSSALGYKDINYYGQFEPGVAYGDIFAFLEDNPGAIEVLFDWIITSTTLCDDDDDDDDVLIDE